MEVVASDSVVSQLCDALPRLKSTLSPTQMSDISAVRAGVHERVFSMYRSAARAYFVFLKVCRILTVCRMGDFRTECIPKGYNNSVIGPLSGFLRGGHRHVRSVAETPDDGPMTETV